MIVLMFKSIIYMLIAFILMIVALFFIGISMLTYSIWRNQKDERTDTARVEQGTTTKDREI